MERTTNQILMEKLRRAAHRMRCAHGHGPDHCHGPGPVTGHGMCHPHMPGPGMRPDHGGKQCCRGGFPRERILLAVLDMGGDGARQKDIAERLGINPSSLSEQIDRLEADRYIERIPNPDDRRSTLVALTEKGRARAYEVSDERRSRADAFCGRLTEEEKETMIRLLDKLLCEQE